MRVWHHPPRLWWHGSSAVQWWWRRKEPLPLCEEDSILIQSLWRLSFGSKFCIFVSKLCKKEVPPATDATTPAKASSSSSRCRRRHYTILLVAASCSLCWWENATNDRPRGKFGLLIPMSHMHDGAAGMHKTNARKEVINDPPPPTNTAAIAHCDAWPHFRRFLEHLGRV